MSFHLLNRDRRRFPKEEELIKAEGRLREATGRVEIRDHPSPLHLKSFAAGHYAEGGPKIETILDHLSDCDSCLATLAEMRSSLHSEEQIAMSGRSRLLLAVIAVLIVAAVCFWAIRTRTPSAVATIDLRQVTRGDEASSLTVYRETRVIRVLLPVGSTGGNYEVGLFSPAAPLTPILLVSGRSTVESGDVAVAVSISLKELRPGPYLLGLRYGSSNWKEYAITIK